MMLSEDDLIEAISAYGVRPAYYNGAHRAYLGKEKEKWSNATVSFFASKEEAHDWCRKMNKEFYDK